MNTYPAPAPVVLRPRGLGQVTISGPTPGEVVGAALLFSLPAMAGALIGSLLGGEKHRQLGAVVGAGVASAAVIGAAGAYERQEAANMQAAADAAAAKASAAPQ